MRRDASSETKSSKSDGIDRFERLVRKHKDTVYRHMVRVCSHREDAEDAVASALVLAFSAADQLKDDRAFGAWLATIGKRVCARMRNHAGMLAAWELAESKGLLNTTADPMEMEVLKSCVREAVASLPDAYREPYLKCEIEEMSIAEAASQLRISEAALKSRLHRARAMVRKKLDRSICSSS